MLQQSKVIVVIIFFALVICAVCDSVITKLKFQNVPSLCHYCAIAYFFNEL